MLDYEYHENFNSVNKLIDNALKQALKGIGEKGVQEWQYQIKVTQSIDTGRYLNSINYVLADDGSVYVGTAIGLNDGLPPYPIFLEFGTSRGMQPRHIGTTALNTLAHDMQGIVIKAFGHI